MNKKASDAIIPALIAGAAAYFGLRGEGEALGDLAKEAVTRVIDTQSKQKKPHTRHKAKPKTSHKLK